MSIITVAWNDWGRTKACLHSIYDLEVSDFEVIVIDNGSVDGTKMRLRSIFPDVRLHRNEKNLGHCRAVNQGFELARGHYIAILDNDTVADPASIGLLVEFLDAHLDAQVVAPRIFCPDGSVEESARDFPTGINGLFGRQSILTRLVPKNRFSMRYLRRENLSSDVPFRVQQVSAACMMFRRELLHTVGKWDEGFVGHWVDSDWCLRVGRAGGSIYCVPAARVVHHENSKRGRPKSASRILSFHRGAYRFYTKHYTRGNFDPRALAALAGLGARAAALIVGHWVLSLLVGTVEREDPADPALGEEPGGST